MKKFYVLALASALPMGSLGCTSTREERPAGESSYDRIETLDTFGDLEEDSEAYPWLSKENTQTGPLGDAMSQSPYARDNKARSSPHRMKKASKRVAKRRG